MGQITIKGGDYNRQNLLKKDKDYLVDQCLGLKKRIGILEQRIHELLPDDCVEDWAEVKFCPLRQGDGGACKQCN